MGDAAEPTEAKSKTRIDISATKSKSRLTLAQSKSQLRGKSTTGLQTSTSRLRMRKQSYGFQGIPGIRPVERTSQLGIEFKRPPLLYLNTYQMDPFKKFHIAKATAEVNDLLDDHFTDHKYNVQESPAIALRLAGELMRRLKYMFNRYRIISICTIGQKRAQSYNNAVTFLWDYERDGYVNVARESTTVFIQVTCFAIYLD